MIIFLFKDKPKPQQKNINEQKEKLHEDKPPTQQIKNNIAKEESKNTLNKKTSGKTNLEKVDETLGEDLNNSQFLSDDQLNEFTYTLIKNFEALQIDSNMIEKKLFGEPISIEKLANELPNKIIDLLKMYYYN